MSQRKEKYLRRSLDRYEAIEQDVRVLHEKVEFAWDAQKCLSKEVHEIEREMRTGDRRERAERQRRIARRQRIGCLVALAMLMALVLAIGTGGETVSAAEPERAEQGAGEEMSEEDAGIEAALLDQGYLSDAVPLSYTEQDLLRTAAAEFDVPYELALAVIERETDFRNVVGDGGDSIGYMQIQERYHRDRMDELDVEDLMDPAGNFRVGCSLLAELLDRYATADMALMAYNMGATGAARVWERGIYESDYSRQVTDRAEYWAEIIGPAQA